MTSKELQAEIDADIAAEVEVMRRRLMGQPVTEDAGPIAINRFIERALVNAAAAGPDAYQIVLRVRDRTCAEINDKGPSDAERATHK